MKISYKTLCDDINNKNIDNHYIFVGPDMYYIDDVINRISKYFTSQQLTIQYFNGEENSLEEMINYFRQQSLFWDKQLVIVKHVLSAKDIKKYQNELISFFECDKNNDKTIILVFDKLISTSKFLKIKNTTLFTSGDTKQVGTKALIKNYLTNKSIRIDDNTINLICNYIGYETYSIINELNKIIDDNVKVIDEQYIVNHIDYIREYNPFELLSNIAKRNFSKANQIISRFSYSSDPDIIPLISLLHKFFANVMIIHQNRNVSDDTLSKLIGMSIYFLQNYKDAAKNYSYQKIDSILHTLFEADLMSKSINTTDNKNLIYLIYHTLI